MPPPGRRTKMVFFLVLGISLVAAAVALTGSWIILNWRERVLLFFGLVFFCAIIAGLILNTVFLVREIRRNERHDSFINAVTHELKTPIASIRLFLETLQRREVDNAQRDQFYRLMLEDTDRLQGTIEQVLKAGEVGYKHAAPSSVDVDFGALVGDCMDLARSRHHLQPQAVRWTQAPNGKPFTVRGDASELRTAVSNILDNAIKYSPGNVDVSVSLDTTDEDHVALRVRDRGMGIPEHELKRIFKRFYRVRERPAAQVKGTGLGLFIVRAIARAHGGDAFAESSGESHGATVTLELPRSEA